MINTSNLRVVAKCKVLQSRLVDLKVALYITLRHTRVTRVSQEYVSQYMSPYMITAIKYVFYSSENLMHETLEGFGQHGPKIDLNS